MATYLCGVANILGLIVTIVTVKFNNGFVVYARAIAMVGELCRGIKHLPLVFKWSFQLSFQRLRHAACEPYENLDALLLLMNMQNQELKGKTWARGVTLKGNSGGDTKNATNLEEELWSNILCSIKQKSLLTNE